MSNTYSKVMLTVIALLLAWNRIFRDGIQTVRAQSGGTVYHAKWVETTPDYIVRPPVPFEKRLNDAVQGGEIVAVVPYGEMHGTAWVIFRDR